jgi:hypothetical protein
MALSRQSRMPCFRPLAPESFAMWVWRWMRWDGIYRVGVHAASWAPEETAGHGMECQAHNPESVEEVPYCLHLPQNVVCIVDLWHSL